MSGTKLLGCKNPTGARDDWLPIRVNDDGKVIVDLSSVAVGDLCDVDTSPATYHGMALTWSYFDGMWIPDYPVAAGHHDKHENGGSDEMSVAGLSGVLADYQKAMRFRAGLDAEKPSLNTEADVWWATDTDRLYVWDGTQWKDLGEYTGATCQFPASQAFSGTSPTSWTDLDLSSIVGSNKALVLLKVKSTNASVADIRFRTNGETDEVLTGTTGSLGTSGLHDVEDSEFGYVVLPTDASGIVEWTADYARTGVTIDVVSYVTEGVAGATGVHHTQHEDGGSDEVSVRGLQGASGWEHIETKKLTAPASSIDFTGLSTDYNAFRLTLFIRRYIAGAPLSVGIRFNDDAGANYDFVDIQGNGAAASSTSATGSTYGVLGSYDDTHLGICFCYVQNVSASIAKEWLTFSGLGSSQIRNINGRWNNTSAKITKITITPLIGQLYADTTAILEGCLT